MNLCFSTLGCTDYSLDEILPLCKQFGISFLEIRGIGGELDFAKIPDFSKEQIGNTKAKIQSAGVSPLILGTSCNFHTEKKSKRLFGKAALCWNMHRQSVRWVSVCSGTI